MKGKIRILLALLVGLAILIACRLPVPHRQVNTPTAPPTSPSPQRTYWPRPTAMPLPITATAITPTTAPTSAPITPTPPPTPTKPPTPTPKPTKPTPEVTEIKFAPGAISWETTLPGNPGVYAFYALAYQSAEILVVNPDGKPANVALAFSGADGSVYQTYNIGRPDWRGMLPKTQEYYIAIAAPSGTAGLRLIVTIYPPMHKRTEVKNPHLGFVVEYDAASSRMATPGYFDGEIFGVALTDKTLFKNTNLQEAYFVLSQESISGRDACLNTQPDAGEVTPMGTWRVNAIDYKYYHTEEGAAGNFYKSELFRAYVHNRCITVRLFTHATDIGAYANGSIKEYDRQKVLDELKRIFFTLRWP